MSNFSYNEYKKLIDDYLLSCIKENQASVKGLADAMNYSLNIGGKRIRPVLALEFCRVTGGNIENALPAACAVELIHTYSLIHDDLPCMDNDDFRRGKPTNHKVYGETTAVIAGDALQAEAFKLILGSKLDSSAKIKAASILADAAGLNGMCGGQFLDTVLEDYARTSEALDNVNSLKTGAILRAACEIGAVCSNADEKKIAAARLFGNNIGLAFQIRDDVLDVIGSKEILGKDIGSDTELNKATYMSLLGEEKCMGIVKELTEQAKAALKEVFSDVDFLIEFADSLVYRNN